MRKVLFFCILILVFFTGILYSQEETIVRQKTVILLPITQTVEDEKYADLSETIYNELKSKLTAAESVRTVFLHTDDKIMKKNRNNFESLTRALSHTYDADACILGEYFIDGSDLHINIFLFDIFSSKINNSYIEILPIDSDLLKSIEGLVNNIIRDAVKEYRPLPHEKVYEELDNETLQKEVINEDRFAHELFLPHHEISASPGTGVEFGRTIYSLQDWFLLCPAINLEYTRIINYFFHIRIGANYIPVNVFEPGSPVTEVTAEVLFGFHLPYRLSFHADMGIAVIYDYNSNPRGVSSLSEVSNFTLAIPLHFGYSFYFTQNFFINFRFKYYGLNSALSFDTLSANIINYLINLSYVISLGVAF